MCPPGRQRDADVGQRASRQHAEMHFLRQMLEDEVLVIPVELVGRYRRGNADTGPARKRVLNSKGIIVPNNLLSQLLINSGVVLPGGWNNKK